MPTRHPSTGFLAPPDIFDSDSPNRGLWEKDQQVPMKEVRTTSEHQQHCLIWAEQQAEAPIQQPS